MTNTDMRFGVIRDKSNKSETVYRLDGEQCSICKMPTEVGSDVSRRYCSNRKCNAMFLEGELE